MPNGKTDPMPERVSPMLCKLVKTLPQLKDYLYEIKWDGYRLISYVQSSRVRMNSRGGLNYTDRYPEVEKALRNLKHDVVIDGEVVVFDDEGKPDFEALQQYNGKNTPISYCVFDLLWIDGQCLEQRPLTERKKILRALVNKKAVLKFSKSYNDGVALYKQMQSLNLEGVVAKRKDSLYKEGERSNNWLKIPTRKRQEFVIGGWAESTKGRSFKSLLFGAYENGRFTWIGRSGGGYKEKDMAGILEKLKTLETKAAPFVNPVLDTGGAVLHYIQPELIANFEFATWTRTGRIRKPATFLGFRDDKKPTEIVREIPVTADAIRHEVGDTKNNYEKIL